MPPPPAQDPSAPATAAAADTARGGGQAAEGFPVAVQAQLRFDGTVALSWALARPCSVAVGAHMLCCMCDAASLLWALSHTAAGKCDFIDM